MSKANLFVIIVAGGAGVRMGSAVPKQFLPLAGMPVLMHSILAFRKFDPSIAITVVLPGDQYANWHKLCLEYRFAEAHALAAGGGTRFHSVQNGLRGLKGDGLVAIHDGVRPLIHPETIARLFAEAAVHANAIPVISPKDSLRWQDDQGNHVVDRTFIKIIQTPQIFQLNKLRQAYVQPYNSSYTDDATVWEKAGYPVYLTGGQENNIKITTPEDLRYAELFANAHK